MSTAQNALRQTLELPAIRERDLKAFLDQFGLSTKFAGADLSCQSCGVQLDETNVGALLTHKGSVLLYCNLSECIDDAALGNR